MTEPQKPETKLAQQEREPGHPPAPTPPSQLQVTWGGFLVGGLAVGLAVMTVAFIALLAYVIGFPTLLGIATTAVGYVPSMQTARKVGPSLLVVASVLVGIFAVCRYSGYPMKQTTNPPSAGAWLLSLAGLVGVATSAMTLMTCCYPMDVPTFFWALTNVITSGSTAYAGFEIARGLQRERPSSG